MIVFPLMLKGKEDLYYRNPQAGSILGCQIINKNWGSEFNKFQI